MKNYAIILASGTGNRYGSILPKQFAEISGKTILEHTTEIFENNEKIDEIFVVITPEYRHLAQDIFKKRNFKKLTKLLNGGKIRKESSYIGINAIEETEANVLIHDCARPFLKDDIILNCIQALDKYQAVCTAVPAIDTIYEIENNKIKNILDRSTLRCAQTPQCFKLSLIKKAHELSKNNSNFTDDCSLVIKNNLAEVYIIDGDSKNIKITYQNDIKIK